MQDGLDELIQPAHGKPAAFSHTDLIAIPQDYVEFLDQFGPGTLDWFLHLWPPEKIAEKSQQTRRNGTVRFFETSHPPSSLPRDESLVAFAATDNGDVVVWDTAESPWTVSVINADGRVHRSGLTTTRWLRALLERETARQAFPDDFPSDPPVVHVPW
jgi:hypothetical protein